MCLAETVNLWISLWSSLYLHSSQQVLKYGISSLFPLYKRLVESKGEVIWTIYVCKTLQILQASQRRLVVEES